MQSQERETCPSSFGHVPEESSTEFKLRLEIIRIKMNARQVTVAHADVAVSVENGTHQDGVLVESFPIVRVVALSKFLWTVVDLMVLLGAVQASADPSRVDGPVEHVLCLRNVHRVGSTESLLHDLVDELQVGLAEVIFLTIGDSHPELVGDKSRCRHEKAALNVLFGE